MTKKIRFLEFFFCAGCAIGVLVFARYVFAATNVSPVPVEHFAWNDLIGWVDFYNTNTITVSSQGLMGYASSSVGDISLDCATSRAGNICASSNYRVTNDGVGNLSGFGWNDLYGWISFDCRNNSGTCANPYEVLIDPLTGVFQNYAWNDIVGWISFNCVNSGAVFCQNISDYKVKSAWIATSTIATLDSTPFDTAITNGARLNSVLWHGSEPGSTEVRFQFATSNASSGPWNFIGPDGTSGSYYIVAPQATKRLDYVLHSGRYFAYRVFLISDMAQTMTPRVDAIIVNWSP